MTTEQRTESHEKVFDADEKITPVKVITVERLSLNDLPHLWRTIFRNLDGKETSTFDSQNIGQAIQAIADKYGYDLAELTEDDQCTQ